MKPSSQRLTVKCVARARTSLRLDTISLSKHGRGLQESRQELDKRLHFLLAAMRLFFYTLPWQQSRNRQHVKQYPVVVVSSAYPSPLDRVVKTPSQAF